MLKNICIVFFLYPLLIFGQAPEPCGPEGEMEPFCDIACIICDIDGFNGINDENEDGIAPDDFCTSIQHNIQWIAFIAGSVDLTLRIDVGQCDSPLPFEMALEVAVYEGIDCDNFRLVTPCNGQINENTSWTFSNTEPLTIGQYYFFVMDGSGGSICDYVINVVEGSTKVPELAPTAPFEVPDLICANQPTTLYFEPQLGATIYDWTINGVIASFTDSLEIDLFTSGLYDICITEANACDEAPSYCTKIEVLPQIEETKELVICDGIPVEYQDVTYSNPGIFPNLQVPAMEGCDSIITLIIEEGQSYETDNDYDICEGDTLVVNGVEMFKIGEYEQFLFTDKGCDSTIFIQLGLIVCNMQGEASAIDLLCNGDGNTGSFTFQITAGTPPFIYTYEKVLDPSINGNGNLAQDNMNETVSGLPSGSYLISVFDNFGNTTIIIVEISEPPAFQQSSSFSEINGFNVSCFEGDDGSISANIEGGTPPYQYQWSGSNSTTNEANNLAPGDHFLSVTDANNCTYIVSYELTQPGEIIPQVQFFDPNCDGIATGILQIGNTLGGTPSFDYSLNNQPFNQQTTYNNLTEGEYELVIQDANGCTDTISQTLYNAEIPEITFVEDITINLGESIVLDPEINAIEIGTILWIPADGLSCSDCLNPTASPINTTVYTLIITSTDGCSREKSITIFVEKDRGIFAPNVFSPNADGLNQYFFISGGSQIMHIKSLYIYDRWGSLVFEGSLLNHKISTDGWDGTIAGNPANIGVYTWIADVAFLDGETLFFTGDVTLLR